MPLVEEPINTSFTGGKPKKAESTPSDKREEGKKTLCKPVPEEGLYLKVFLLSTEDKKHLFFRFFFLLSPFCLLCFVFFNRKGVTF